jgi:NADPH-dependent curcumin reductase CurA
MTNKTSREIHLKSRPTGLPTAANFELVEVPIPAVQAGHLLVRNLYMSVDPYMRGRMRDAKSYAQPFALNEVMNGGAVGQVVESQHEQFQVGDFVSNGLGWREYFMSDGIGLTQIDPTLGPIQSYLGALGMPGMTAYVGLLDIAGLKEGEQVFVSGDAGAVGSIACQIAKAMDCRVVGSAGSTAKVDWLLKVAGIDGAFNYKEVGPLPVELDKQFPQGIDVYFENVGGEHLDAALTRMNNYGRIALCGMISQYNTASSAEAYPIRNLGGAVGKRLTLRGYIVSDHRDRMPQVYQDMGRWIAQGKIQWQETIVEGLENAPQAFIGLFQGENLGKMLVKIGDDPA